MNIKQNKELPHVVIVGAGFGGLRAARALAHAPVRVTLVDRNNYHLFQPLLYQVATAGISPDEIAHPVRAILRGQKNFEFQYANVECFDLAGRYLKTDQGEIHYDTLVLAVGGETNYFGNPSLAEHTFGLKSLKDSTAIRSHLLRQFELANEETDPAKRRSLLTFVAVGGGPTGVECAGAISELARMLTARDYPNLKVEEVHVILLEGLDRLLAVLPPDLSEFTLEALHRKHVDVRFGALVQGYDGQTVSLKDGSSIDTRTVIWAAGVRAASLMDTLESPKGSLGRLKVGPTLQLPEHPEVFVIGDAAYLEDRQGKVLPMVAPVAMQQAETAARNIQHWALSEALENFNYKDPGALATIGRNQAVAKLGKFKFRGFMAWMVWLIVHIMQLIGFRNRLVVLINWTWDYLFYDRAVRLIDPD